MILSMGERMKKYYINRYTLWMIMAIIMGALSLPLVAYAFASFDSIYSVNNIDIKISDFYTEIFIIALAMIFSSFSHIVKNFISNIQMNNLRKDIFRAILGKSPNDFHRKDSGEYYNYVLKKVDTWQSGYYDQAWNIIQQIMELICIFILVFYINNIAGFICIVVLIPLVLNNIIFPRIIGYAYNDYLEQDSKMIVKLKEFLAGFNVIKFNLAENVYSKKLNFFFDRANKCNQKISFLNNLSGSFANICVVISQAGGVGISLVLMLKGIIGIGHFIALTHLLSYANEPVINLINSSVSYASIKSINRELSEQLAEKNTKSNFENKEIVNMVQKLKLCNVTYKYTEKQNYIFSNFSQTFVMGKKYLIIGESGSGKSTLVKILMGLIKDIEGSISLNNDKIIQEDMYKIVGFVPQDVFIFDDTIRNNIDLLNKYTDNEVEEVIERTQLSKFVKSKLEGMNCKINEEVLQVSGGERARIGLARVMLDNRPIVILDEILSSLDSENAYKVEKNILELQNKIVIHIAHKSSSELLNQYDQVIDLGFQKNLN